MMFLAGVHWAYFASVIAIGAGGIVAIFQSRGQTWQLLNDYQYRRIDTFLDLHLIRWAQDITSPSQKLPLVRAAGLGAV